MYKHWSYHKTTYLPLRGYLDLIAFPPDRATCERNPTGTKDAINEIFMEARVKHLNAEILGTTIQEEDKVEIAAVSWKMINMPQPEYELETVTAMIMQHANVAFLPDVSSFCNTGARLNGFVVNDSATLKFALNLLNH